MSLDHNPLGNAPTALIATTNGDTGEVDKAAATTIVDENGVIDPGGELMQAVVAADRMPTFSSFLNIALMLKACGKVPGNEQHLSVQIGCHLEEFSEFLKTLNIESATGASSNAAQEVAAILDAIGRNLKQGSALARIYDREAALDALCDTDVTGNGVAYLARMNKVAADFVVAASNFDKLNADGAPVILEGGKIGKREGWEPPDLSGLY